jgi:hypothetical protein
VTTNDASKSDDDAHVDHTKGLIKQMYLCSIIFTFKKMIHALMLSLGLATNVAGDRHRQAANNGNDKKSWENLHWGYQVLEPVC